MTLPFQEKIVNEGEYSKYNFEHPNFIGYLNPHGEVLDYSNPLGIGGHNCDRTTAYFEHYFRMPTYDMWTQQIDGKNIIVDREEWHCQEGYKFFKQRVQYNSEFARKYGRITSINARFLIDMELFFYNCYQAQTFMEGFGQDCMILNELEFYERYCEGRQFYQKQSGETEQAYRERCNSFFDSQYYWYKKGQMLDWYKTVIVQYMHYHLIDRCKKGITTSDSTPNATFYNYLLNDFEIHQIPRMIFDEEKKMYVPYRQSEFLIPDSELRLQEEIQAIKRLVPPRERTKYYR